MIDLLNRYYSSCNEEQMKEEICELILENMKHYASYKLNLRLAYTQDSFPGYVSIYKPVIGGNRESRRINSTGNSFFIFGALTEKDIYSFYDKKIKDKEFALAFYNKDSLVNDLNNDSSNIAHIQYQIIITHIEKYQSQGNDTEYIRKILYEIKYLRFCT